MKPLDNNEYVLGIDPGNVDTAYCYLRGNGEIGKFDKVSNVTLLHSFQTMVQPQHVVCEMICSYGMPAGASLFDTCVFIGQLREIFGPKLVLLPRLQVKLNICKTTKANDSTIRCALIDKFGPQGTKKAPGPTYGISADVWSALAISETYRSGDFTPYKLSHEK